MREKIKILVGASTWHRSLNGMILIECRQQMELSQAEFALACGWSQQYQQRLECPEIHEVHICVTDKITKVVEDFLKTKKSK